MFRDLGRRSALAAAFLATLGMLAPAQAAYPEKPIRLVTFAQKINQSANRASSTGQAREKLRADGAEPVGATAAAFKDTSRKEIAQWGKVVQDLGIKPA